MFAKKSLFCEKISRHVYFRSTLFAQNSYVNAILPNGNRLSFAHTATFCPWRYISLDYFAGCLEVGIMMFMGVADMINSSWTFYLVKLNAFCLPFLIDSTFKDKCKNSKLQYNNTNNVFFNSGRSDVNHSPSNGILCLHMSYWNTTAPV